MEELQSSEASAFVVEGEVEPLVIKVRNSSAVFGGWEAARSA
jgi:hypothetical protein